MLSFIRCSIIKRFRVVQSKRRAKVNKLPRGLHLPMSATKRRCNKSRDNGGIADDDADCGSQN